MCTRMKLILFLTALFSLLNANLIFANTNKANSVIVNPQVSYSDEQFSFTYQVTNSQTWYRIFIDTTQDPQTGYYVGQLGAKFLLENNYLYSYVGPGWKWQRVTAATFTNVNSTLTWTISRDAMGDMDCAGAFDWVAQVETGNTTGTAPKATLSYTADPNCPTTQKVAVPSYFDPCTGTNCSWTQLNNAIPQVGIAIINPNSGPGSSSESGYVTQTRTTHDMGASVIGYVWTNYGAIDLAQVESQVDDYYNWYNVDGIFFDGGYSNDCSMVNYYETLNAYVKAKGGQGLTIINYGTNVPSCYINASDILVNFEDVQSSYVNWTPLSWYAGYPANRFWQIIYDTPQSDVVSTVQLAKQRNAGWVYVTSLGANNSNPYAALPSQAYWNVELGALS